MSNESTNKLKTQLGVIAETINAYVGQRIEVHKETNDAIETMRGNIDTFLAKYEGFQKEISTIRETAQTAETSGLAEIQKLTAEKAEIAAQITTLESTNTSSAAESKRLNDEIVSLKTDLSNCMAETHSAVEATEKMSKNAAEECNKKIDTLNDEYTGLVETIDAGVGKMGQNRESQEIRDKLVELSGKISPDSMFTTNVADIVSGISSAATTTPQTESSDYTFKKSKTIDGVEYSQYTSKNNKDYWTDGRTGGWLDEDGTKPPIGWYKPVVSGGPRQGGGRTKRRTKRRTNRRTNRPTERRKTNKRMRRSRRSRRSKHFTGGYRYLHTKGSASRSTRIGRSGRSSMKRYRTSANSQSRRPNY